MQCEIMRCKICGYRANSIRTMGAHYRREHPVTMRKKYYKTKRRSVASLGEHFKLSNEEIRKLKKLLKAL